jgi:hypothetical protein
MKYLSLVLVGLALSGCALEQSKVTPLQVPVADAGVSVDVTTHPLQKQAVENLKLAATRQGLMVKEYNNLDQEQHVRDVAILGADVGLSATAIFRGDVNSLKWAGAILGLGTYYDKAIPLSVRIAAAQSGIQNYNSLILAGNVAISNDLDADKGDLDRTIEPLNLEIAVANGYVKQQSNQPAPNPCKGSATQQATCLRSQLAAAQKTTRDVIALQASIAAATTTQTNGQAAQKAVRAIPLDIASTTLAIDNAAEKGLAFTVDASTIATPFSAVAAPKAANALPPAGEQGPPDIEAVDATLKADTASLQAILDRVDYVSIDTAIKSAAPPTPSSTPSKSTPAPKANATNTADNTAPDGSGS